MKKSQLDQGSANTYGMIQSQITTSIDWLWPSKKMTKHFLCCLYEI